MWPAPFSTESSHAEDMAPDQYSADAYSDRRKDPNALERQLAAY
jgi:hypothetical protein